MQHDLLIKKSFGTIIDVFKSRPDLSPVSPVAGLPEIKMKLKSYGKKSPFINGRKSCWRLELYQITS